MHKLLFLIVLLFVSFISYVVYAVCQQAENGRSASEIVAELMSTEPESLAKNQHERVASQPDMSKQMRLTETDMRRPYDFETDSPVENFHVASNPVQLTIKHKEKMADSWTKEVEIEFSNASDLPVQIVKPLDGSFYGWYQPHYKFTVTNLQGHELELMGRCGNSGLWADTTFPESYLVTLEPDETYSVTAYLPFPVPESGEYEVSFEYIYNFKEDQTRSPKNEGEIAWTQAVEGVWQGTAQSNSITLELKKNN
jgi:hypothetical protein